MDLYKTMERLRQRLETADCDVEHLGVGVYRSRCPLHNDKDRQEGRHSLLLELDSDKKKIVMTCSQGCKTGAILATLKVTANGQCYDPAEAETYRQTIRGLIKPLTDFEEKEARWLIDGWIPEGQITLMASDGGVGKTTVWCSLAAAVSKGTSSLLNKQAEWKPPGQVLIFSAEDSVRQVLKKKLRLAGANMDNIAAPDLAADKGNALSTLRFGSKDLSDLIRDMKPALCIFDPVQGFLPPHTKMVARNDMRESLAPLIALGEETGTSFLIICHSNKRKGAAGRDRISDSSDLWDIARSVIMLGYTEDEGIRYLSNEKNNYGAHQQTILFRITEEGTIEKTGTTSKRDRDFTQDAMNRREATKQAPKRDDCKQFILDTLNECKGSISVKDLDEKAKAFDYGIKTLRTAKAELKASGEIDIVQKGSGRNGTKVWHVVYGDFFKDVTGEEPLPWEQMPMEDAK
ncbi:MAG: AAA family ATPase [Clostridia bacterium]|nr:AAA family ATPase [Clostridia bacterium]